MYVSRKEEEGQRLSVPSCGHEEDANASVEPVYLAIHHEGTVSNHTTTRNTHQSQPSLGGRNVLRPSKRSPTRHPLGSKQRFSSPIPPSLHYNALQCTAPHGKKKPGVPLEAS